MPNQGDETLEPVQPGDDDSGPGLENTGVAEDTRSPSADGEVRRSPRTIAVRYGLMGHVGEFSYPANMRFTPGRKVVIATDRGIEIGQPIPFTCAECTPCASREQMRIYARNSGGDAYRMRNGRILRQATDNDLVELYHIERDSVEKLDTCIRFAAEAGLQMKIVDCEHLFGGERIVFYFMSEERVDFRELVRRLAAEYQTRIEMRQVGARDEARLLADYETCGRECCCRNLLKTLKPINMQMAKMQKATLDPAKVSGRCGRLKCCLRYEHETYESLVKRMPRMGSRVACSEGVGKVVDRQILTQLVRVLDDDGRLFTVAVEELSDRDLPLPPPVVPGEEPQGGQRRGPRERSYPSRRPARQKPASPAAPSVEAFPESDEDIVDLGTDLPTPSTPQAESTTNGEGEQSTAAGQTSESLGAADRTDAGPPAEDRGSGRSHHKRRRRGRRRGGGGPRHGGTSGGAS